MSARRSGFLTGLALATTYALTATIGQLDTTTDTAPASSCEELAHWPAMVAEHGQSEAAALWSDLMAQGWHGDPTDGTDTIILPPCYFD